MYISLKSLAKTGSLVGILADFLNTNLCEFCAFMNARVIREGR